MLSLLYTILQNIFGNSTSENIPRGMNTYCFFLSLTLYGKYFMSNVGKKAKPIVKSVYICVLP